VTRSIAIAALAASLSSCRALDDLYRAEVAAEIAKHPAPAGTITEADLAPLPPPVQRYFRSAGFVGQPRMANARLTWDEMYLKRGRHQSWMKLACSQFNSAAEPMRIALMKARLGAVIPFEARDKFQDGHGNMLIKLARVITVADATGPEMDHSGLVTVLAESLMFPAVALQPYVAWRAVDDRTAAATLSYGGLSVSGTFHFNDASEPVRFDTSDRWQDGKPPRRIPWSAETTEYQIKDGVKLARRITATWHDPAGDFTYVKGTISAITFNVTE
jgi:hypothetical protein